MPERYIHSPAVLVRRVQWEDGRDHPDRLRYHSRIHHTQPRNLLVTTRERARNRNGVPCRICWDDGGYVGPYDWP